MTGGPPPSAVAPSVELSGNGGEESGVLASAGDSPLSEAELHCRRPTTDADPRSAAAPSATRYFQDIRMESIARRSATRPEPRARVELPAVPEDASILALVVTWSFALLCGAGIVALRARSAKPAPDVLLACSLAESLASPGRGATVCDFAFALVLDDAVVQPDQAARAALLDQLHRLSNALPPRPDDDRALEDLLDDAARRASASRRRTFTLADCQDALIAAGGRVADLLATAGVRFGARALPTGVSPAPGSYRGEAGVARVLFWNDDKTPMVVVRTLLEEHFGKAPFEAFHVTIAVHHKGWASVGEFPAEEALTRAAAATERARAAGYPLRITVER